MNERDIVMIIRRELAQIAMGRVTATDSNFRAEARRFANDNPFDQNRLIQPYGLASRPKPMMESLLVPIGSDPSHMVVVGQNDTNRPAIQAEEVALYGPAGQVVYMKANGGVHQGSLGASSPAVLGDVLIEFATELLNAFLQAPQVGQGALGPVFLDPSVRLKLQMQLQKFVQDASTNFLAQKIFVERGA
jgi:hypothetical protein